MSDNFNEIIPYNNGVQYIPKDTPDDGLYPVEYYIVSETDINASDTSTGNVGPVSQESISIGSSGGAGTTSGGGGGSPSLDDLIPRIQVASLEPLFRNVNEGSTITLSIVATIRNDVSTVPTYQWQVSNSGPEVWVNIPGATQSSYTTDTISFANDHLDRFRCVVSAATAANSPFITDAITINVRRIITITTQPIAAASYVNGTSATFSIVAQISSGVIEYQWQKQEFQGVEFVSISGATQSNYTTPILDTIEDSGDIYRCVLTNANADTKISEILRVIVTGADFEVIPSVSGVTFWRFSTDGPLILDPSNSTNYIIKPIDTNRTKISAKMWGQGSCNSLGGYTESRVSVLQNQDYAVVLNSGAGPGSNPGGGYVGIFDGTTVSQATALAIAGGAGGGGRSSTLTCTASGGTGGGITGGNGAAGTAEAGGGAGATQSQGGSGGAGLAGGEQVFATPGTYTWVCPSGVTSVSIVCIGGGGGGASGVGSSYSGSIAGHGGGGGALAYRNNYSVTPGQSITVQVGGGGSGGNGPTSGGQVGGDSFFQAAGSNVCWAGGGGPGDWSSSAGGGGAGSGGIFYAGSGGGGGGAGGSGGGYLGNCGGGGGAGGYAGSGGGGGAGGSGSSGSGGAAGGGGGGSTSGGGGGGGVNPYGQGSNGSGGGSSTSGGGGSGGNSGASLPLSNISTNGKAGGSYGGGGGGAANRLVDGGFDAGRGQGGAVRIIWGISRSFPSTNVGIVPTYTVTNTYTSTGTQTLFIPAEATNISYEIVGGAGGEGGYSSARSPGPGAAGALGQRIIGTLSSAAAGKTLTLRIAGNGGTGGSVFGGSGGAGYTTGGSGGNNFSETTDNFSGAAGGGGGGSAAILDGSTRIVVAGGGGGGAPVMFAPTNGHGSAGLTSNILNQDTGTASAGAAGGNSGASFNGGGGGGGGGNPGGFGGGGSFSGNDISGEGGFGGAGYRNSTYVSTASVSTASSNSRIIITYSAPGRAGSPGAALQGGAGGAGDLRGGGGGGGYYGGGGGAGNVSTGTAAAAGGGAGFVSPISASGFTSSFANSSYPYRQNAGSINQNSRFVVEPVVINITQQPSSAIAQEGQTATFNVVATVSGVTGQQLNYEWQKLELNSSNWTTISGAINLSYTTASLTTENDNGDKYRCILSNDYCSSVVTTEALLVVSAVNKFTLTEPGFYSINLPIRSSYFDFKIWGAGGEGTGEGSVRRGGSGAFAKGRFAIASGNTNTVNVFVGATGSGSQVNEALGYGSGAAPGGQYSRVVFDSEQVIVGGGGGAGQGGHGGFGGGANRSGGAGTGSYAGGGASISSGGSGGNSNDRPGGSGLFFSNGFYTNSGGSGGGAGVCCGKRGGGGGAGYYGGGGGGGGYSDYDGSGGGGGVGFATTNITNLDTTDGLQGTSSGATAPNSSDPDYVSGRGGSSQNGLAVIEFEPSYKLIMDPAPISIGGTGGPLDVAELSPFTFTTSANFTAVGDIRVRFKVRGATRSGLGGYATGTVLLKNGQSYRAVCDSRYAGLFYGSNIIPQNCILLGAEGGYQGLGAGGNAGFPSGSSGQNFNNSGGGGGGTTNGYLSGSGGFGGYRGGDLALAADPGTPGGLFSAGTGGVGTDGIGGNGGFGYYGGGGGGGGWDYGSDYGGDFGGGGGGGSNYVGGIPAPPTGPYQVIVTDTVSGSESGGVQIEIISIERVL